MHITPLNSNYTNNNNAPKQAFGAKLGNMEDFIGSLLKLGDHGDGFFKQVDENSKIIEKIKYGKLEPKIHVEIDQTTESLKPFNFIVFSDLSENLSGDALFQYKPRQSVEKNMKRFITTIKQATKNIKDYGNE